MADRPATTSKKAKKPPKPGRKRRVAGWTLLVIGVLIAGVWGASRWWGLMEQRMLGADVRLVGNTLRVKLSHGARLEFVRFKDGQRIDLAGCQQTSSSTWEVSGDVIARSMGGSSPPGAPLVEIVFAYADGWGSTVAQLGLDGEADISQSYFVSGDDRPTDGSNPFSSH